MNCSYDIIASSWAGVWMYLDLHCELLSKEAIKQNNYYPERNCETWLNVLILWVEAHEDIPVQYKPPRDILESWKILGILAAKKCESLREFESLNPPV